MIGSEAQRTTVEKTAATTNYNGGQVAYVVNTAKGTLNSYTATGYEGTYDGSEHGITVSTTLSGATIKYSETKDGIYTTTNPTYTDVGTYTVYYQVIKSGYNTVEGEKQVVITKADGTVVAPTAKTLTYTVDENGYIIYNGTPQSNSDYIRQMVPNISPEVIEKQKTLQSGTCLGFGSAFKIPVIVKLEMPDPAPLSSNSDVIKFWGSN